MSSSVAGSNNPSYPSSVICKLLNITDRRLRQLASEGKIPKEAKAARGRWFLVPTVRAYILYLQERAQGKDVTPTDHHHERTRLIRAQADKAEIELEVVRASLCSVDHAMGLWSRVISDVRARLLTIPTKGAPMLFGLKTLPKVKDQLEQLIYDALLSLVELDVSDYVDSRSIGAIQTTDEIDDQSVERPVQKTQPGSQRGTRKMAN